jgi:hypothetical protein
MTNTEKHEPRAETDTRHGHVMVRLACTAAGCDFATKWRDIDDEPRTSNNNNGEFWRHRNKAER